MTTPCQGSTKPDAGVMVPSPATAPEIMPSTDGLPRVPHSSAIQVSAPGEAGRGGGAGAGGGGGRGRGAGARGYPPRGPGPRLKPNQPTQSRPVPITASARL